MDRGRVVAEKVGAESADRQERPKRGAPKRGFQRAQWRVARVVHDVLIIDNLAARSVRGNPRRTPSRGSSGRLRCFYHR